jgi:outer membrane lipoprotein-sorting protein
MLTNLAALGLALIARGPATLSSFNEALSNATAFEATYKAQVVGQSATNYKITLQKPNKARIETNSMIWIADGSQITKYDKKSKTYFKTDQTPDAIKKQFNNSDLLIWNPFFKSALKGYNEKPLGTVNRKGMDLEGVSAFMDESKTRTMSLYLDGDRVARQAQFEWKNGGKAEILILDTSSVKLNGALGDTAFAFNAPDGSKEVSFAEMEGAKWFTDLEEAKRAASASGRKIFVDFFATWCGPCKRLAADVLDKPEFGEKMAKSMVFCRIDVDERKDVAQAYNIEAMPTQMVLNADGSIIATKVGYGSPDDFWGWITQYGN